MPVDYTIETAAHDLSESVHSLHKT